MGNGYAIKWQHVKLRLTHAPWHLDKIYYFGGCKGFLVKTLRPFFPNLQPFALGYDCCLWCVPLLISEITFWMKMETTRLSVEQLRKTSECGTAWASLHCLLLLMVILLRPFALLYYIIS